jgi:hypothetical protein
VAGFSTTAASIGPRCTRSFAISTSFWSAGPCGNTNAFAGIVAGLSIGLAAWLVESPGYLPIGLYWAYGQRLDDGSRMSGDVQVRFCEHLGVQFPRVTHLILCFQYREDAERVLAVLTKRFAKYGLTLHPEKTRLLAFGRSALSSRPDAPKPATFDFLGFTHVCARSRRGRFTIHLRTMRKRLRRSGKAVAQWCQQHRHDPVEDQAAALNATLRGHDQYYGRPTNYRSLWQLYRLTRRLWHKWLNRRTRGKRLDWDTFQQLLNRHPLSRPRICHAQASTGSPG